MTSDARKAVLRERSRVYREANRDKIRSRARERYRDPEGTKPYKRTEEESRRASIESGRRYYAKHREKIAMKHKADRAANPEKYRERAKRDYYAYQDKIRNNRYMRRYGISQEDYDRLSASQGHVCLICGAQASTTRYGILHVDHDHGTGEIRGLLCNPCNAGLGHFRDDPAILARAHAYLRKCG